MIEGQKIVMGLSGGMDSATLLGQFLEQGNTVYCCIFTYGSKHNKYENKAAVDLLGFYKLLELYSLIKPPHFFHISNIMNSFNSALFKDGEDIPEGHYNDESMKKTVVPGRNLIFSSIMAGLAESVGADYIGLGVHSGDHHIYPDCRKEFIKSLDNAVFLSSDRQVQVITPFEDKDKAEILKIGYNLHPQVPYHLTRTCYKDQVKSCGRCGPCTERLEAFEKLGVKDPIEYE